MRDPAVPTIRIVTGRESTVGGKKVGSIKIKIKTGKRPVRECARVRVQSL